MSLQHPRLSALGLEHGFGLRDDPETPGLLRPKQVHGARVVLAEQCRAVPAPEADAVLSREPGTAVGVVTADCVPVFLAATTGTVVLAAHAGWRGLAGGVLARSVDAMRRETDAALIAVIGPHIGACCYEVDSPVLQAMEQAFGPAAEAFASATRPGHAQLDLEGLSRLALRQAGLGEDAVEVLSGCTRCDQKRFHSYRRDGPRSGRLVHRIAAMKA